jgi:arylsulfatase A-like enzyme
VADRPRAPERLICGALPTPPQIGILRGLYLGDVHAADEKLGEIVAAARAASKQHPLITVATSDHGELFGEDMLLDHKFSVHAALLRVPLVVNGVAPKRPIVVETPVGLVDLMPSILSWAGVASPDGLPGLSLPLTAEASPEQPPRTFFTAYTDAQTQPPEEWVGKVGPSNVDKLRQFCTDSNRVFGAMASLIRYPWKYVWYERYPASLFDLSWDPAEQSDQTRYRPELVESFEAEMKPLRKASGVLGDSGPGLSKEAIETLKQLGYVE